MKSANPTPLADTTGEIVSVPRTESYLPVSPCPTVFMGVSKKDASGNKLAKNPEILSVRHETTIARAAGRGGQDRSLFYHLYTIWLFTRNDLKTVVFPQIAFALFNNFSGRVLSTSTTSNISDISSRVMWAIVWIWINLLFKDIANQRLSDSISEDAINKPWRPIPSRRLDSDEARRLLIAVVTCAFLISWLLDVTTPSIGLMALTWLYDDLGGSGDHYLLRHLLTAFGLLCFGAGATFIIGGQANDHLTHPGRQWFFIIGAVITTTVHVQDLEDMDGDVARDRKTIPIVWGERAARYSAAGMIFVWSLLCPIYWNLRLSICCLPGLFGLGLAIMIVRHNSVAAYKLAWKLWCLWIVALFALPLCADSPHPHFPMPAKYPSHV
ncbi:hypothetical protein GJ744_005612 [Endocarpon pusillum]|uniref:UbiA prenyltransferase n=1 Tax=Endocarpon pusillum TaxID=364733 RepID=A0A8H7A7S9_9EURO|nr:hypothetical protein GJ744_005612 [Endocarpon pusillum]